MVDQPDRTSSDQPDHTDTEAQLRTDQLREQLIDAVDQIEPSHWAPPTRGIIPQVRILSRWVNVLWAIPLGAVGLVALIAFAQEIRLLPATQRFIARFPGAVDVEVFSGFPAWLMITHYLNLRLRLENQLGFKMVKWIQGIELVHDFRHIGAGYGGYHEDHEYFGNRVPI